MTEEEFEKYLWTTDLVDPEIIIRTEGDRRLSNFLLWKSAYSELFFIEKKWPAFEKKDFLKILKEYKNESSVKKGK